MEGLHIIYTLKICCVSERAYSLVVIRALVAYEVLGLTPCESEYSKI